MSNATEKYKSMTIISLWYYAYYTNIINYFRGSKKYDRKELHTFIILLIVLTKCLYNITNILLVYTENSVRFDLLFGVCWKTVIL